MRRLVLLLAVLGLAGCSSTDVIGATTSDATQGVRLLYVIDGDTVKVRADGQKQSVRLIGIDTPERGECGFEQATAAMERRLRGVRRVRLVYDTTQDHRDRYGRLLAYVESGGTDVGRAEVRDGWADVYVYDRPFRRLASYRKAARSARDARRGVNARCGGDFHRPQ